MKRLIWIVVLALVMALGTASAKSLSFVLDSEDNRADEAQAIAAQLKEIGIDVQARVWEWTVLKEQMVAHNRDAFLTDWGSAYFDPFDLAIPKFGTGARGNYSGYSNALVDEAFETASTTVDDATRTSAYHAAQEQIFNDAPWAFGYVLQTIEAASTKVKGWAPAADNSENMAGVTVEGGDSVVVGMRTNALVTFDPAMYRDRDTEAVLRNIYDSLTTATREGKVEPGLASAWRVVDDVTFEFDLVSGVAFSNGEPLTADDIVFTFDRVITEGAIDGNSSPRAGLLGPIDHVEKVDDSTVRFVYQTTFPQELLLQALTHFQIVPQDYITEVGNAGFASAPVGSGPFTFARGSLDSQVVLQANPTHWRGAPELSTVVFRMMPEPSTRIASLLSGEIQIAQAIPPDLVERLTAAADVIVMTAPGTRSYEIEFDVTKPPFDDVRVRQAINYAIDWDSILTNLYQGYGTRLATAFLPSGFGYDASLDAYPYDPEKARELLKEAGYDVK